jgi:hypothetical protein
MHWLLAILGHTILLTDASLNREVLGSLVKVAFILADLRHRQLIHESKTPVQMASFTGRHHPAEYAIGTAAMPSLIETWRR